jgi:MoxR-like ATPase
MNIIEKRSRIRDLKKDGTIPAHAAPMGSVIVSLTNEDADRILNQWDTDFPTYTGAPEFERGVTQRELEPTPTAPRSNGNGHTHPQPAPAGDLAAIIAALVAPHVQSSVTQQQFDTLAADSATLAEKLDELAAKVTKAEPREIRVISPDGTKREIGRVHKGFDDLLTVVSCEVHAFLTGPAGSFKTTTAQKVAEALGLEFSAISICQQTTQVSLLGYMNAGGNYISTEFRKRYEEGGVFLLDEIDNGNANVLAVLNSALANGHCAFPDGMISRHPDFRLIATANTYGNGGSTQYVGRCQLDGATLDRFAFIDWQYDEELEREIAGNDAWCDRVFALRRAAAALGSRLIISPRATFEGAKLLAAGMAREKVEKLKIWKGTSPEEQQKIEARA